MPLGAKLTFCRPSKHRRMGHFWGGREAEPPLPKNISTALEKTAYLTVTKEHAVNECFKIVCPTRPTQ